MNRAAILFGLLLIILGLVGYFSPTTLGEVGDKGTSPTALIPAGFGAVLLLCGLVVEFAPTTRKHMMHLAALIGVLGLAGAIMNLTRGPLDLEKASARSSIAMAVLCGLFVILCIRSFVLIRIARHEGLPEEPWADEKRSRQKPV
jgi:hypothetical protein